VNSPRILVIVPVYNGETYLAETLESLRRQQYKELEVLVQDRGSTDRTLDIVDAYADVVTSVISAPDAGQADALARGLARSSGDILTWLNADDAHLPWTLQSVAEAFSADADAGLVYGDYCIRRSPGGLIECKPKISFDAKAAAFAYMPIPQPSAFFSAAAYRQVGGVDPSLDFVMDYDLFLRMGFAEPRILFRHMPTPLSLFRVHDESKSVGSRAGFAGEIELVHEKLGLSRPPSWLRRARWLRYMIRTERMFLRERGILMLRKDRSFA
jgi:glycosyltransferase involved in cell wall biosynthesis